MLFDGRHTKGRPDGKWVNYKGYEQFFNNYTIQQLRLPPNSFEILDGTG